MLSKPEIGMRVCATHLDENFGSTLRSLEKLNNLHISARRAGATGRLMLQVEGFPLWLVQHDWSNDGPSVEALGIYSEDELEEAH